MKNKIKFFLLKCLFVFLEPQDFYFYDGEVYDDKGFKTTSPGFKENRHEYEYWTRYYRTTGSSIRAGLRTAVLVFAVLLFAGIVFMCGRTCYGEATEKKDQREQFNKKLNDKYDTGTLLFDNSMELYNKLNPAWTRVVHDVFEDRPVFITEIEIDGCEYYICSTVTGKNTFAVSMCHKANCKSQEHK